MANKLILKKIENLAIDRQWNMDNITYLYVMNGGIGIFINRMRFKKYQIELNKILKSGYMVSKINVINKLDLNIIDVIRKKLPELKGINIQIGDNTKESINQFGYDV